MPIIAFLISWVLAAAFTGGEPVSFLLAVMCAVIYTQGRRIKALEQGRSLVLKDAAASLAATAPQEKVIAAQPLSAAAQSQAAKEELKVIPPAQQQPPPVQSKPAPASAPARPKRSTADVIEGIFGKTLGGFIVRGNPIARIGVIVLFFGVIFALKFAADEGFFPVEVRLLCAAIGAFALLGIGWKLRARSKQFAVTMQGAGTGVFYITAFIAFRLYHMIPGPLAFGMLIGATVLTAALAVLQNARTLAFGAMVGGFLAPALTSEGGGSHIMLFSYLALLNLGIFGICWFRSWRELNLTGFFFTFVMASMWGERYYRPEFLYSSMAFLIFFLVLYSLITVMFTSRSKESGGTVDTLMTFGTPLWAFLLQYGLVRNIEYALAWSAAGFGAFHIILARAVFSSLGAKVKLLVQSYFFIGLCFLSLAIPLAFSGRLTAAIWAVEGLALIWSGIKQKHGLTRFAGQILLLLSSFFFFSDIRYSRGDIAFLNPFFEGIMLLAFAHLFSARLLTKADAEVVSSSEKSFATLLSYLGLAWWIGGGSIELFRHINDWHDELRYALPSITWGWVPWALTVFSAFASVTVLLFWFLARALEIRDFRFLRKLLMPFHVLVLAALTCEMIAHYLHFRVHPFMSLGFVSWFLVFAVHYGILRKEEQGHPTISPSLHFWGLVVGVWVLTWQAFTFVGRLVPETDSWSASMLPLIPAVALILLSASSAAAAKWPFKENSASYLKSLRILALWLVVSTLVLDISESGAVWPLPYIPVLNPLDIAQAVALMALVRWWMACRKSAVSTPVSSSSAVRILSGWAFIWATILLLRCVHHYGGVEWDMDELLGSNTVQAALSIFWSVLALVLMTSAHFKGLRPVWKAGACLIGVVVLKLFLIDLSSQGTVSRIAAFLGVGILMLCIGYFAPIPPEKAEQKD